MAIHDWTRVNAGIFHHFHHRWIAAISDGLNAGLLPPDYYALAEQIAGGWGPDVLTLQGGFPPPMVPRANGAPAPMSGLGTVSIENAPPRVRFRDSGEP